MFDRNQFFLENFLCPVFSTVQHWLTIKRAVWSVYCLQIKVLVLLDLSVQTVISLVMQAKEYLAVSSVRFLLGSSAWIISQLRDRRITARRISSRYCLITRNS